MIGLAPKPKVSRGWKVADETIEVDQASQRAECNVRLSVVRGPHEGLTWVFDRATELTIGREAPANLVLPNESALSRCHLTLRVRPPIADLEDNQSRNGTLVNGIRLSVATLQSGDRFGVGQTEFLYQVESREQDREVPM